jgi:hypothetical protein
MDHGSFLVCLNRTSYMTSLIRPTLSSLLCCVIAFGQLPALLHVVDCHRQASESRDQSARVSSGKCTHGCQHPASAKGLGAGGGHEDDSSGHDSDHCSVCQSLTNPVGVVWNFELPQSFEYLCEPALICAEPLPVEPSVVIPQPRGPPLSA